MQEKIGTLRLREPSMAARVVPVDGDIVVREERRDGACTYVLRTVPGADQLTLPHYEQCVQQALAFAARAHVRAWLQGEDGKLQPLQGRHAADA